MKKMKLSIFVLAILLLAGQSAFALVCAPSRNGQDSADQCWTSVTVASNETNLVSAGTVLVFDVANAQANEKNGSFKVRFNTSSANGVRVAGVAQQSIASGATANVLIRGRGDLAVNTQNAFASGDALFVGVSADGTSITSTTQTQLGFALETQVGSGTASAKTTKKAYITIV